MSEVLARTQTEATAATPADPLLQVRGLLSGYGQVTVLRDVALDIGRGEIVALLGSNGAGKSTLINTVCRFVTASAGTVRFDGGDIAKAKSEDVVRAGLIQVPEGRRIFPDLSVRENLELGAYRRGGSNLKRNYERVLDIFPRLRERLTQHAGTMSGGEQQMLAIGRGLMGEPVLLILDEPSLGLSPLMVEEMFGLIRRLHGDGLSILLVEQNVSQSLEIAQRAYVIENGEIGFSGTPGDLLASPDLKRAYLGL
jgi:branched-chain amino acid transport system ATP-binding protein